MRAAVLIAALVVVALAQAPSDYSITSLPRFEGSTDGWFSGYVNTTNGDNFMMFFESSPAQPSTAPLVLWLNGGPGCSSLGGCFSENGPTYPNSSIDLSSNPYSWNTLANMIYLESPPGVGFSLDRSEFLEWNDERTAKNSYEFLQNWLSIFTEYQGRDFYITGESYGGHYLPQLAQQILDGNNNASNIFIPLKGFQLGNPLTDAKYDSTISPYYIDFMKGHLLYALTADNSFNTGAINPYDILQDICQASGDIEQVRWPHPMFERLNDPELYVFDPPPCIGNFVTDYLNLHDVKVAIHADTRVEWAQCGGPLYQFSEASQLPLYENFLANTTMRILIYSGDEDTVVPALGTQGWATTLQNLPPPDYTWGPWYSEQTLPPSEPAGMNVAGYGISYGSGQFQYFSVKGAGHMVPEFAPRSALTMFSNFLTQTPFRKHEL